MTKKSNVNTMLYFLVISSLMILIFISNTNSAFAFFGFFLNDGGLAELGNSYSSSPISLPFPSNTPAYLPTFSPSSDSLQSLKCYFPYSDIINSCNPVDITENNTGFNYFGN